VHMSQRALCVTDNLALRRVLRRTLSAAGIAVGFVDRCEDLQADEETPVDLVVVDSVTSAVALPAILPRLGPKAKVVILGGPFDAATAIEVMRQEGFDHLLGRDGDPGLEEDEIVVTSVKLLRGDLLGVEKYLTWGVPIHRREVGSYDEKRAAIREVTELAREMGCRRQVVARVETVTDELLMNALYDAPASRYGGRPLFQGKGRPGAGPVTDEVADLRFGCDGRYFAVSVRDAFGELRKSNILDHLERARDEKGLPRLGGEEGGGGGLGLYFILNSVSRFIANIQPGEATEVICLFDLRGGARGYHYRAKSLSIFVGQTTATQTA
jgi:CheY-like chemotaxis protein